VPERRDGWLDPRHRSPTRGGGDNAAAGTGQTLSVLFTPDDTNAYTTATAQVLIDVARAPLTVAANNASKVFGAPLPPFNATFIGLVNGDTPASLSGTLVLSTTATPASPAGGYPITPSGLSSPNYDIAFQASTLTITPAATTVALFALPSPVGFLQPVFAIGVVSIVAPGVGTPDGTVVFREGTTVLGTGTVSNGVAFVVLNGLPSGAHSITAVYTGAANFLGSTSTPGVVTVQSLGTSTFTLLFPITNPVAAGQPATFAALVLPLGGAQSPTGNVQFTEGSVILGTVPLSGGVATIQVGSLSAGAHLIGARYVGNATFAASTAPPIVQTVYVGARPGGTSVTVAASPTPGTIGAPMTFTATVTPAGAGAPTGLVGFFADGFLLGVGAVSNVGGAFKATLATSTLTVGTHLVTASYIGDAAFSSGNSLPIGLTIQPTP
jgi:hypothetical protein